MDLSLLISDLGRVLCSTESVLPPKLSAGPGNCQLLPLGLYRWENCKERSSRNPCENPCREHGAIGLGTGFWFFHEILSFHVADVEYNPQNREY